MHYLSDNCTNEKIHKEKRNIITDKLNTPDIIGVLLFIFKVII